MVREVAGYDSADGRPDACSCMLLPENSKTTNSTKAKRRSAKTQKKQKRSSPELLCYNTSGETSFAHNEIVELLNLPILVPAATTASFTAAVGCAEGMAAAAAGDRVGVVDGEASAHQAVHIVNLAALDILQAHFIYKDLELALGDNGIALLLFIEGHAILQP